MTEHFQMTKFGFEWGPVAIERHISDKGYVVFGLKTKRVNFDVYVTPTGMVKILVPQGQSVEVVGGRERKK